MYSLRMSFWIVPRRAVLGTPWRCPTATYIDNRIAAVALIVIEVLTSARGIWSKRRSMSASEEMATPTRPTSPRAASESLSYPI